MLWISWMKVFALLNFHNTQYESLYKIKYLSHTFFNFIAKFRLIESLIVYKIDYINDVEIFLIKRCTIQFLIEQEGWKKFGAPYANLRVSALTLNEESCKILP